MTRADWVLAAALRTLVDDEGSEIARFQGLRLVCGRL